MEEKKRLEPLENLPYSPNFYDRQSRPRLIEIIQACAKALARKEKNENQAIAVHTDHPWEQP